MKISDDYLRGFVEGEGMFYIGIVPFEHIQKLESSQAICQNLIFYRIRYGRTPIVIWGAKENKKSFASFGVTIMSDSIQSIRSIFEGIPPQYERTWGRKPLVCQLFLSRAALGSYVS